MVTDTCQDPRRGCLFTLLSILVARESQCLLWSHLAKSLGQATNFEVQQTTTTQQQHNFAFYAANSCTWELCSGGGDLLKVQPGHSIGPRKLWNAGALTCVIHSYTLTCLSLLLTTSFYSDCISSKTMASQKLGNQCKGFSPFIAGWRLCGIQVSRPDLSGLRSGLHGLAIVLTSLDLPSSPVRRVRLFLQGPVVPHVG